jgi:ribonucleoside-diphosphate reductase alpha chain
MTYQIQEMNAQRQSVFMDRYALRRKDGRQVETDVNQMNVRVSLAIGRDVHQASVFNKLMDGFGFVPGGRVLSGAGGKGHSTLYNCFVIGIRDITGNHGCDSRVAIMNTMTRMVEINARGGGVGINWSVLRPSGAYIAGVDGHSSGPNCWMQGADALADQIRQGGSRTAALMFMLNDWHPDAPDFAKIRQRFKRANFSMAISDAFIEKAKSGGIWHTIFPDTSCAEYNKSWDGGMHVWQHDVQECGSVPAKEMLADMAQSAWEIGSPGVVFLDQCQRMSNTWYRGRVLGTNPCGEQPLPENGCCNLGSLNIPAFWDEKQGWLDWGAMAEAVRGSVSFLDRVIDVSPIVDPRIQAEQAACRRIGLGTMGLADYLILMGIRYGSRESIDEIDKLYGAIRDEAYDWSCKLAREQGVAPGYDRRFLEGGFIRTLPKEIQDSIGEHGIRNLALLTQAPTGTTSILAGVSSGIEPVIQAHYMRKDATGCHEVTHPLFAQYGNAVPDYCVTAAEVTPKEHILVQAAVQRFVDSSVSKTINLPFSATQAEIAEIYMMAYDCDCKGITVYRSGSGENDVIQGCASCQL